MEEKKGITLLACVFPGCEEKVAPEKAWVPQIAAIRQAEGKSSIAPADIDRHVLCASHADLARRRKHAMYTYLGTVRKLEQRIRDKEVAKEFFAKYNLPKQETAVGKKLREAGWLTEGAKKALKPQTE